MKLYHTGTKIAVSGSPGGSGSISRKSALGAVPLISSLLVSLASVTAQTPVPNTLVIDNAISQLRYAQATGACRKVADCGRYANDLIALRQNNLHNPLFLAAFGDILPLLYETKLAHVCSYFAEVDPEKKAIRFGESTNWFDTTTKTIQYDIILKTIVISPINSHGVAITITFNSDPSDSSVKKSSINFIIKDKPTQEQHDDLKSSLCTFFFDSANVQLPALAGLVGQKKLADITEQKK